MNKDKETVLIAWCDTGTVDGDYVSEDVSFFRALKQFGIIAYAQTGAFVDHMKTVPITHELYNNRSKIV